MCICARFRCSVRHCCNAAGGGRHIFRPSVHSAPHSARMQSKCAAQSAADCDDAVWSWPALGARWRTDTTLAAALHAAAWLAAWTLRVTGKCACVTCTFVAARESSRHTSLSRVAYATQALLRSGRQGAISGKSSVGGANGQSENLPH